MSRRLSRLTLTLAVAATLAACQAYPTPVAPTTGIASVAAPQAAAIGPQDRVILRGHVQWSDMRHLMAAVEDVASPATITLMDADGTPVAAGLADTGGDFTLYESTEQFTANTDELFTLEVTRRGATNGSETLLSLSTVLQYDGDSFTSITGETIVVSALTTAITQLVEDDTTVDRADVIGNVTADVTPGFGAYTTDLINDRADAILAKLAANIDPNRIVGETFTGDVRIETAADAALLKRVKIVTGNLRIDYVGAAELDFPRLEQVGGDMLIWHMTEDGVQRTNLTYLSALRTIDGALTITENALTSLSGLGSLTAITGTLSISNCSELASFDGLDNLETIGGIFSVSNLAKLADMTALGALTSVVGGISFENLTAVGLTTLGDFTSLEETSGISLVNLSHLESLDAFPSLASTKSLTLSQLHALVSLSGLGDITFETSAEQRINILISDVPLITDLTGLGGVQGDLDHLDIGPCHGLVSLAGLGDILSIKAFNLGETAVTTLAGLPGSLTSVDHLGIENNNDDPACHELTNLAGLDGVTINNDINLSNLDGLTSLDGPSFPLNFQSIIIRECGNLETLGFPNTAAITNLSHHFRVNDNPRLASIGLTGLAGAVGAWNVDFSDSSFQLTGSPLIPYCDALNFSAHYPGARQLSGLNGTSCTD